MPRDSFGDVPVNAAAAEDARGLGACDHLELRRKVVGDEHRGASS
jgi:hypothetical protein